MVRVTTAATALLKRPDHIMSSRVRREYRVARLRLFLAKPTGSLQASPASGCHGSRVPPGLAESVRPLVCTWGLSMSIDALFRPLSLGAINAPHRVFMAPLSRMRATPSGVPQPITAQYYAQRAGAGLVIGEGTSIGLHAEGFPAMPGIYTPEHVAGWRTVTDGVRAAGGRMAAQIVHHGRTSHSSYGAKPVGPSAISAGGYV